MFFVEELVMILKNLMFTFLILVHTSTSWHMLLNFVYNMFLF